MELLYFVSTVMLVLIAHNLEKIRKTYVGSQYAHWEKDFRKKYDVRDKDKKAIGDE